MNQTKRIEEAVNKLWTMRDLERIFRVTSQTIQNWRNARALPTVCIRGDGLPALRFVPADVRRWAEANNVRIYEKGTRRVRAQEAPRQAV